MSKTRRVYLIFFVIFLVGFIAVYIYIKLFLEQQSYVNDTDQKEPISFLSELILNSLKLT